MISSLRSLFRVYYTIKVERSGNNSYYICLIKKGKFIKTKETIGSLEINTLPKNERVKILNSLHIHLKHRSKGYCRLLLIELENMLQKEGVKIIIFTTKNENLLKCSLLLNYQITNKYTNSSNEKVYFLNKTLNE